MRAYMCAKSKFKVSFCFCFCVMLVFYFNNARYLITTCKHAKGCTML